MKINLSSNGMRAMTLMALATALVACGGGGESTSLAPESNAQKPKIVLLKGGSGGGGGGTCTGSCSGGGGTPVAGTNPLPIAAPAPDVVVHESFGPGPQGIRPKGGKGDLRSTFIGTTLGGFWAEWPGSKDRAWITPSGEATWKFAVAGGAPNVYALPSPLEPYESSVSNGVIWADTTDGTTGGLPTALLPIAWPATTWSVSMEAMPSAFAGGYVALGLTNSGTTIGNLASAGIVSLQLSTPPDGSILRWELWQGGATRTLLASGATDDVAFNQIKLTYNPQTQTVTASVNGVDGGSFTVNLGVPRYAAIEGIGIVDNFVVRKLSAGAP